ncbi:hypothetical protein [Benzoatithermus flavus]|uniref:Major facilitator superfamily (MFS) profile domain-containing protein n=1 Tax=Benzoatithermus flavus TaxID=3108223 RepID=A0ABU8XRG0_9PROT
MPAIAAEFATTPGQVGLLVTAFTLACGLCRALRRPIGDRLGKYRIVMLACPLSAPTAGAAMLFAHRLEQRPPPRRSDTSSMDGGSGP